MRLPLLLISLLLVVSLSAQSPGPVTNGFQLTLTLEPELERSVNLNPYVTAVDTVPLAPPQMIGNRLFTPRRETDTINLGGVNTVYFSEPSLNRSVRRTDALFTLLTSVRLHYRFSNFEAGLGFAYRAYTNSATPDIPNDYPDDFFYRAVQTRRTYGAIVPQFTYHPLRTWRLRPYVGLQLRLGISHSTIEAIDRVFPSTGMVQDNLDAIVPRFRDNTIYDFDLRLLWGVNYRLNEHWAIGFEATLSRYLLPREPRGLQIRYLFGHNKANPHKG